MLEKQAKTVFLSIGSNLGNKKKNIEHSKILLKSNNIEIVKTSKNYETQSWPDKKKPKFINIVLKVRTKFTAKNLLKKCLEIEKKIGPKRNKKNEPRVCDIDIIDYNGQIIKKSSKNYLILPHPEMHKRNFVLIPLFDINKSWFHPLKKTNIINLIKSLKIEDIRSIKVI